MREDRPNDDKQVVVEDKPVDGDSDLLGQKTAAKFTGFILRTGADGNERRRIGPLVVEDADVGILRRPFLSSDAHQSPQRRLVHRLMRSQRHQVIQRGNFLSDDFMEQPEEEGDRRGARSVGDDDQHALAPHIGLRQYLGCQVANLGFG